MHVKLNSNLISHVWRDFRLNTIYFHSSIDFLGGCIIDEVYLCGLLLQQNIQHNILISIQQISNTSKYMDLLLWDITHCIYTTLYMYSGIIQSLFKKLYC
mgnify:CR=1 FL=1